MRNKLLIGALVLCAAAVGTAGPSAASTKGADAGTARVISADGGSADGGIRHHAGLLGNFDPEDEGEVDNIFGPNSVFLKSRDGG